jgi:hypothetical protein
LPTPTKNQELVSTQSFKVLTMRRANPTEDQELVVDQSFRASTMSRANPAGAKREDNF